MAKNISYNRSVTEKFHVKGELSEDTLSITYVEGKGDSSRDEEILIEDCLKPFAGWEIELTLIKKDSEELDIGVSGQDE